MHTFLILIPFIFVLQQSITQDDQGKGYTISGTVLNSIDQSPVQCRVRLKGRGYIERVDTDSLGYYVFMDVPAGRFELVIGLSEPERILDTILFVGSSVTINATKSP